MHRRPLVDELVRGERQLPPDWEERLGKPGGPESLR